MADQSEQWTADLMAHWKDRCWGIWKVAQMADPTVDSTADSMGPRWVDSTVATSVGQSADHWAVQTVVWMVAQTVDQLADQ